MKVMDSFGPNPRGLRIYLKEKGLEIPNTQIDIGAAENRAKPYTDKNPGGQIPALELDDGTWIAETVAIYEYLEEKNPDPPLIGKTAEERAETRMWHRRVELQVCENIFNNFRFGPGLDMFKDRFRCLPEAAEGLKKVVEDKFEWLDPLLQGKQFICGDRFTTADIALYCAMDFIAGTGLTPKPEQKNLLAWKERVGSRESVKTSLHPAVEQLKLAG